MKVTREQMEEWLEKPQKPELEPETKWQAIRPLVWWALAFVALTLFTTHDFGTGLDPAAVVGGWAGFFLCLIVWTKGGTRWRK
jgi:hypothetical protein